MTQDTSERVFPEREQAPASVSSVSFELARGDRWFLLMFCVALFTLLSLYAWQLSSGGRETIEIRRQLGREYVFQLDMNSATWVEWMQLDGLGEVMARRIVDDRESRGPFHSIEDLQRVKGIGPATFQKLRLHLRCEPPELPPRHP